MPAIGLPTLVRCAGCSAASGCPIWLSDPSHPQQKSGVRRTSGQGRHVAADGTATDSAPFRASIRAPAAGWPMEGVCASAGTRRTQHEEVTGQLCHIHRGGEAGQWVPMPSFQALIGSSAHYILWLLCVQACMAYHATQQHGASADGWQVAPGGLAWHQPYV